MYEAVDLLSLYGVLRCDTYPVPGARELVISTRLSVVLHDVIAPILATKKKKKIES